MKTYIILIIILVLSFELFSQTKSCILASSDSNVYSISDLDSIPIFIYPKGEQQDDKIAAYIKDNQLWPNQDDGVFIVFVKFVIETDGTVSNIEIAKGINPDYDKEAIRLVQAMPAWKPGTKNNQFVRTEMMVPIKWTIFND